MLRARKKDVRIKPNRKLDKRSSRGMLYENEELRLRTIEINAEVERGQTDIKKLRRENDHLRREMWALRDEYERLEKLIKHLDLAGTGSEHHQRGHQHSDGEGGGRAGDDDDDEDDRASPSINGRNTNSEGSEDDEPEGMDRSAASEGFAAGMSRSKSQTVMMTVESRPPMATPVSATTACQMDQQGTCHGTPCGQHRAVYVECGNPDKDNIENYQKAYGRMPRRCSSAGSKVYVATQHFHPHAPVQTASVSSVTDSTGRVCYESLSAVKSRYSTSGMEDEDGYAACSHPVRVDLRDFLHPPGCSQSRSVSVSGESGAGLLPPTTPPPPIPLSSSSSLSSTTTTSQVTTTAIHSHPVHRGDFVVQEDLVEAPDEGGSSGVEADDEPSAAIGGAGGFPPDTPSEDGDFNLDHLVNIVRSFQQEQQLHQSGLVVATCTPPRPTSPDVLVEEADDDVISRGSSSPEAGGMATIKRRPVSSSTSQQQQQQHQRHRQMSIIEKESSNDPVVVAEILSPVGAATESSSTELGGDCGAVTYAQPTGRGAVRPSRRNSFSSSSSSSSSSASGSPTAAHSSTVVFLNNNNNNNNNMNNNKKMGGGGGVVVGGSSGGNLGNSRGSSSSVPDTMAAVAACAATSSTIDSIMVTSSRKSSSPIRLVQQQALPPPPAHSSCPALEPTVVVSAGQGALSRRRVAETGDGQLDERSCLSVYPLPDGDASASLLRLHAVDPHTVSFDVKDLTGARSVTVQEVIDQLEQQLDPTRCHVRGVRMLAGSLFFISLDSLRSLQYLLRHSFRLRGHRVRLTDVSAQTWIVSLTGVPHYISDATVSLLLAAFGTIIGDVERRFFRGVDTGERLVRFRLKGHAKLPRHITVGGCRIQVRRMSPAPSSSSQHTEDNNTPATFRETLTGQSQFHPTGMNRRLRLDSSQTDYQHPTTTTTTTHFQSSSNANNETANAPSSSSSLVGGGDGIYGTKMSTASTGDPAKKSVPKIGRSFEYRSQLRVDLRMSAEVPVPPLLGDEDLSSSGGIPAGTTPSCPVCDQQQSSSHPTTRGDLRRHSPPPPPLPPALVIHRCRHHESVSGTSPVGPGIPVVVATTGGPSGDGRVHRESPPKSRVSVNFDETAAASSGSRVCSGTGTIRPSNTKTSTSSSSNGILRKSVSGEEPPTESGNDGGSSGAGSADAAGQAKNKNGVRMTTAKKTARSFSLVDTFRVNKERRKPIVRVETVIENTSAANPEEGVRTLVVRRDSTESSSRSSRSSRKSNELPWCGCWGNGCL